MRDTRLIFIDGLPGSGKTTTATWLASRLQSDGRNVMLLPESHPEHPLNVGGSDHPSGYNSGEEFFQRYTPASFVEEGLRRWEEFVEAALRSDSITILDSFPFQGDIRVLLQLDASNEVIRAYAGRVEELVAPLAPTLVYFRFRALSDAMRNIEKIGAERGAAWTGYVVAMAMNSPYARARDLKGFDAAVAILGEYRELTESVLHDSITPRIVLEECAGRWEECRREIEEFLEIG